MPLFTPSHRGGSGLPLVLLHGFLDTWRTWELVLPALERRHDVLALQRRIQQQAKAVAPHAAALLATPEGRRRATR